MTPPLFVPALGRSLYPGASVALDFTRNLYRSGTPVVKGSPSLLSGWTFTRASTGYAETAAGALVAFASGEIRRTDKGLLVEEARTNLFLRSQEFDNGVSWSNSNLTVTANATTAPDGTLTADKLEVTTSAGTQSLQTVTAFASTSGVMSIYGKIGSGATDANKFAFYNLTTATVLLSVTINWTTGAITHITGSGATSQAMAGGWWRIILPVTSGITSGDNVRLYAVGLGGAETAGEFCYLWGAQLEAGSFATSYIPTGAASATRALDEVVITGLALHPTFTVFGSALWADLTTTRTILSWNDGTTNNRVELGVTNAEAGAVFAASGGAAQISDSAATTGGRAKNALSFDGADYRASVNGATIAAATGKIAPVGASQMNIGRVFSATQPFNNYIERIIVYPLPRAQAQLNALTT